MPNIGRGRTQTCRRRRLTYKHAGEGRGPVSNRLLTVTALRLPPSVCISFLAQLNLRGLAYSVTILFTFVERKWDKCMKNCLEKTVQFTLSRARHMTLVVKHYFSSLCRQFPPLFPGSSSSVRMPFCSLCPCLKGQTVLVRLRLPFSWLPHSELTISHPSDHLVIIRTAGGLQANSLIR